MYKLTNSLVNLETGSTIGQDMNNRDYQEYLAWLAAGNIPQGISLEEIQASKITEIDICYQNAITTDLNYMGTVFQTDIPTHENIKSVISCGEVPTGFCWFDINNNPIPMTFTDLLGFSKALVFRGFAAFAKKQTLKAQIRAATDVTTVQAIIW